MAQQLYSFDPGKGETQEQLRKRREIAQAMVEAGSRPARDLGEGLASFGNSVFGGLRERWANESAQNSRQMVADALLKAQQGGGITLENSAQMMPYADEGQRFMIAQTLAQQDEARRRANENEDWTNRFKMQDEAQNARLDRSLAANMQIARMRAADGGPASAPVKNYLYRQTLVKQYGERSPEVAKFDNYVRATQYLNLGDRFVQPDVSNPGEAVAQFGVGAAPKTEIQDDRIVTAPGVPGRINTVVDANTAGPAPGMPSAFPLPGLQPQAQPQSGPSVQPLPPSPTQATKAKKAMQAVETTQQVVQKNIDQALAQLTPGTTGLRGYAMGKVPGTDAYDLRAVVDTIKANIGFDKLQAMREASPTGGALGQVSDFENRNLQATLGNLDTAQSMEQVQRALLDVKRILAEGAQARREAYAQDFGVAYDAPEATAPSVPGGLDPRVWEKMTPEERALWN